MTIEQLKSLLSRRLRRIEGVYGIGIIYDNEDSQHIEIAVADMRMKKDILNILPKLDRSDIQSIRFVRKNQAKALSKIK